MRNSELISSFSSVWVNYDSYEYKKDFERNLYVCPTKDAKISIYKTFDIMNELLPDILNIGRLSKLVTDKKSTEEELKKAVLGFARKYGLLGLMNYYPYNERFMNENKVYLPEDNGIMDKEVVPAPEYVQEFIPFATKDTFEIYYDNSGNVFVDHKGELPVTALTEKPLPFEVMFSRHYCERYQWIKDYATRLYGYFGLLNSYYKESVQNNEDLRERSRFFIHNFKAQGMKFGIKLHDTPVMEWQFNSLRAAIDTIFGVMVSGSECPIKMCKHDQKVFYAKNPKTEFCSPQCRNQFNVYKSRKGKSD